MVQFEPFRVEQWMDKYEDHARYNIAETCADSLSLQQLQDLSGPSESPMVSLETKMTYGEVKGLKRLRVSIAELYSSNRVPPFDDDNVVITQGAIAANHLAFYSLVEPGDHVICHYPTYQQLYATPKSLGADVDLWKASPEQRWIPRIEELRSLIRSNTKLIILNNPNNPTGAILPRSLLLEIVDLARTNGIIVMSDEVYRPIFHSVEDIPPSILSLGYENTVATGSLSKAYSLAGIRVGWLASRNGALVERVRDARHYTTISVSMVDSHIAAHALAAPAVGKLLARNVELARTNLRVLERFVSRLGPEVCGWVRPLAGTTAFVCFKRQGKPVDAAELCRRLLEETGVLLVPGDLAFGSEFKGFVRVGFVCATAVLEQGLAAVEDWIKGAYNGIPLAV